MISPDARNPIRKKRRIRKTTGKKIIRMPEDLTRAAAVQMEVEEAKPVVLLPEPVTVQILSDIWHYFLLRCYAG